MSREDRSSFVTKNAAQQEVLVSTNRYRFDETNSLNRFPFPPRIYPLALWSKRQPTVTERRGSFPTNRLHGRWSTAEF